tara:strand:+ start:852 stop:1043 length:192 start_codon:yes stop_codon:yes gene_type:complete
MSTLEKIMALIEFLGDDMSDAQAERIGDMARDLTEYDIYKLEELANGTLYYILRQICAEKRWM